MPLEKMERRYALKSSSLENIETHVFWKYNPIEHVENMLWTLNINFLEQSSIEDVLWNQLLWKM